MHVGATSNKPYMDLTANNPINIERSMQKEVNGTHSNLIILFHAIECAPLLQIAPHVA